MIEMRKHFTDLAIATLLAVAPTVPGHAEDAAPPPAQAAPAATQTQPPASVPRPSIAPKSAEPAAAPVADNDAPRRHRRYAHRHYRHYAYWDPFPVYWPHFYRRGSIGAGFPGSLSDAIEALHGQASAARTSCRAAFVRALRISNPVLENHQPGERRHRRFD